MDLSSDPDDFDAEEEWELFSKAQKLVKQAKDRKKQSTEVKKEPGTSFKNDKGRFGDATPIKQTNTLKRATTELESMYLDLDDAEKPSTSKKKRAQPSPTSNNSNATSNNTNSTPSARSGAFNNAEIGFITTEMLAGKDDGAIGESFLAAFPNTQRTKQGVKGKAEKMREQMVTVLLKPSKTEIESSGMPISLMPMCPACARIIGQSQSHF